MTTVNFGLDVGVWGDRFVVSGRSPSGSFNTTAYAWIYSWNGSGWQLHATKQTMENTVGYGNAVAIDPGGMVVGDPRATVTGQTNRVLIFDSGL